MNFGLRSALRWALISAAALLLLTAAGWRFATPAAADPAMWVVKDQDSTIYLLGTLHLLKPDTAWRSDKIATAFASSEEVWLEAAQLDGADGQALVMFRGFDYERPLADKLPAELKARLDRMADDVGLPPEVLEHMRPWLAALTISIIQAERGGYNVAHGVDLALEADVARAGKRLITFATPEEHIMIFAGLPEAAEIEFLVESLLEPQELWAEIDAMAAAWSAGDSDELYRVSMAPLRDAAPHFFEAVMTRRNIAWSERIAARMAGSGTSFIAVGAGHMVGQDSLPALLAARGFAVEPY